MRGHVNYISSSSSSSSSSSGSSSISILFIFFWMILGIVAFIMSISCFGYNGTTGGKIIGLLIAIFLGPFYWIYYIANGSYCIK